jgi:outer membrane protein insertion porin family
MNRLALYLGANLGYVTSFKDNSAVPPNELYIMGGNGLGGIAVTPLRGYPDPQQRIGIGPRDEAGNILRAQVQSRYVAELRFALSLNPIPIYVLAFAEAGNTWLNINQTDPFDLKRSAGLGLRLLLNPIGLIGFDYGYGFDKVTDQSLAPHGWQFHFQFGR